MSGATLNANTMAFNATGNIIVNGTLDSSGGGNAVAGKSKSKSKSKFKSRSKI